MNLTIGSLFSGIGGLELGLERSGFGRTVWQVEINPCARSVLRRHWPDTDQHSDITEIDGLPKVDAICGGFPCQDLSHANTSGRLGLAGAKSGLWREFARIVDECGPRFVIVENVADGWRDWVPVVRCDLRRLGYSSVSIRMCAEDVGAPFRGARAFVVAQAYRDGESARAVDAQMALLPELTRPRRQDWGQPSPEALGVADGVPGRMERLRMMGNAVVPQCAEAIGRALMEATL